MFDNLSEAYLWNLTRDYVQVLDTKSHQYLGMGQTERFLRVVGKTVVDNADMVASLFDVIDGDRCKDSMLDTILEAMGLSFIPSNLNIKDKRDIIKTYPTMVKYIGTRAFLDWILWKVLKWRVASVAKDVATNLLRMYEHGEPVTSLWGDNGEWILFDKNAVWTLTIITSGGVSDPRAREWVIANVKDWILSVKANII